MYLAAAAQRTERERRGRGNRKCSFQVYSDPQSRRVGPLNQVRKGKTELTVRERGRVGGSQTSPSPSSQQMQADNKYEDGMEGGKRERKPFQLQLPSPPTEFLTGKLLFQQQNN